MNHTRALLLFFMGYWTFGQNIPVPNIYIAENRYLLSSAWAGIGDCFQARLVGSTDWTQIKDAPSTFTFALNGRLSDHSGIGGIFTKDQNGYTSRQYLTFSYAHHLILDYYKDEFLSFGISGRYSTFGVDTSDFEPDPVVGGNAKYGSLNFDLGVLYRRKGLFATVNVMSILKDYQNDFNDIEPLNRQELNFDVGYNLEAGNNYWTFQPSVNYHLFLVDKRAETDFNLKATKDAILWKYWAGISFRARTDSSFEPLSITPMAGIQYERFYFSYGYQSIFTNGGYFTQDSHIFSVGFDFLCFVSDCKCTY